VKLLLPVPPSEFVTVTVIVWLPVTFQVADVRVHEMLVALSELTEQVLVEPPVRVMLTLAPLRKLLPPIVNDTLLTLCVTVSGDKVETVGAAWIVTVLVVVPESGLVRVRVTVPALDGAVN
jgi:hypothetical protein